MYQYKAVVTKVIDGDTIELDVDLGFRISHIIRGRLYNVNAPELFSGAERDLGKVAREFVETLLLNKTVLISTYKDKQTFGRWVVMLYDLETDAYLNEQIETYCKTLRG